MTSSVTKWRVWCNDEDKYVFSIREKGEVPTVCPNDGTHSIREPFVPIENLDVTPIVKILEEDKDKPTGGHFAARTFRIEAPANRETSVDVWWDYPVSALSVGFISGEEHRGDKVGLAVAPNTPIGAITWPVGPSAPWNPTQNYTEGQHVLFPHPTFGLRTYTCIKDTVGNDPPILPPLGHVNSQYWIHGLVLQVTESVIQYMSVGRCIHLNDGTNVADLGRCIYVDKDCLKIRVNKSPHLAFMPSLQKPVYVLMTAYMIHDYELSEPWEHIIGESKIGGSYVPADTIVRLYYDNRSDKDKIFVGSVEYLE